MFCFSFVNKRCRLTFIVILGMVFFKDNKTLNCYKTKTVQVFYRLRLFFFIFTKVYCVISTQNCPYTVRVNWRDVTVTFLISIQTMKAFSCRVSVICPENITLNITMFPRLNCLTRLFYFFLFLRQIIQIDENKDEDNCCFLQRKKLY